VSRLLVLLLIPGVDSHFLRQGIFVDDCQYLFRHPGILHGELADQERVSKSFLEEHDDGFIIDLRDDVSLVAEPLNKFSEGLSLLLYNTGQVPFNSWLRACVSEVADELPT
jgi:hypothetical protein